MSRKYRRNRSYRRGRGGNPIGLLVLLVICLLYRYWKFCVFALLMAAAIVLLRKHIKGKTSGESTEVESIQELPDSTPTRSLDAAQQTYTAKDSIMSDCERKYFEVIRKIVEPEYTVQPQINLASVINKDAQGWYRNELFRNIDFGIFDCNYKLLVLIEINDQTHTSKDRRERDQKVKAICEEAHIPLITFWTKYGVNENYIRERLATHLDLPDPPVSLNSQEPTESI